MPKAIFVSNRTIAKITTYFFEHNNGTLVDWDAWYRNNRERYLVVTEMNPNNLEHIAWETLSRDEFDAVYDIKHYGIGRDYSPHYEFIECYKHGFDQSTQCWRKIMAYPDYEVNRKGSIRRLDDQDSEPVMQFRGRRDADTEGWYAKLEPRYGGKKEMVWLDQHIEDRNLGEAEYKA
jgi:hypothetical protein